MPRWIKVLGIFVLPIVFGIMCFWIGAVCTNEWNEGLQADQQGTAGHTSGSDLAQLGVALIVAVFCFAAIAILYFPPLPEPGVGNHGHQS